MEVNDEILGPRLSALQLRREELRSGSFIEFKEKVGSLLESAFNQYALIHNISDSEKEKSEDLCGFIFATVSVFNKALGEDCRYLIAMVEIEAPSYSVFVGYFEKATIEGLSDTPNTMVLYFEHEYQYQKIVRGEMRARVKRNLPQ